MTEKFFSLYVPDITLIIHSSKLKALFVTLERVKHLSVSVQVAFSFPVGLKYKLTTSLIRFEESLISYSLSFDFN